MRLHSVADFAVDETIIIVPELLQVCLCEIDTVGVCLALLLCHIPVKWQKRSV
jgi:hypothetical protein